MRWRRQRDPGDAQPEPTESDQSATAPEQTLDVMLADTIARHVDGATVEGRTARLGALGVDIECVVHGVQQMAGQHVATLHFWISGERLFERPALASVSGYHESVQGAIVEGGCLWACTLIPVLRAALDGESSDDVEPFEVVVEGRRFRGVVSGLDRTMHTGGTVRESVQEVRTRLGGEPWLTTPVIRSGTLPILPSTPTLLSVFVGETPVETTPEVKVNGGDWQPSNHVFTRSPGPIDGQFTFMRELAVLVPLDPPRPLDGAALRATLDGVGASATGPWSAASWMGWSTHAGQLGPAMDESTISALETTAGPLPADYRHFLELVAGSGAGPGYGLVTPAVADDRIVLAHAGCGVDWVMRLDPSHRGEVWVDAAGSDGRYELVARTFEEWYRDWLDASVRNAGVWTHWDHRYCANTGVLSQMLDAVERELGRPVDDLADRVGPGSIAMQFDGQPMDPCHACVVLAARFGLDQHAFAPGVLRSPT